MFKNYLKVALRNILRHKGHSFINIAGMAIGIACCLLLVLWVQDELSYDRNHENAKRIYRVVSQYEVKGNIIGSAMTPAPLGPALIKEFAWIQRVIRIKKKKYSVKYKDKIFNEYIVYTDPEVFDVFTFPLVKGNPKTALSEPYSILISEEMKKKYFAEKDPIGKIITLNDRRDFKITGVFKNIPRNSHFGFHFLASFLIYRPDYWDKWGVSNFCTYILTAKNPPIGTFKEKMPQFVEKYKGKESVSVYKLSYLLQPLTGIHLYSHLRNEIEPNGDIRTVYIFSAIALFILLIACLNYINLATARFMNRAKEVGLRKVLGASPGQLVKQFLGESFLFALIALPLAALMAEICLPLFNSLSGKTLAFHYLNNLFLTSGLIGVFLFVGLVSGIGPALFISAFPPMAGLRGTLKANPITAVLRRFLVVFQFSISILFIIISTIIFKQLHYMRTTELGLNKENLVNIHINHNEAALQKYKTIKYEFSRHPNVTAVSASSFFPGRTSWRNNYWHEDMATYKYPSIFCFPVDFDFIDTFQIPIIEGRDFSRDFPTDEKNAFLLNESAVKEFGWQPSAAIGKKFNVSMGWKTGTIIGVVRDFHFNSLHKKIEPVVIFIEPSSFDFISVRIKPGNISQTLGFLKKKWNEFVPGQMFAYSFLDDDFDRLYKTEFRLQKIFIIVSILAVFIACLGLLGLTTFAVEQRTKEIGIRKVLGASAARIVLLLSKEFTRWIVVGNIFAWPIAWYAMNQWLQNFAYRTDMGIWIFLSAGIIVLVIALLTVSLKVVKAASSKPVDTLRYE